MSFKGLDIDEQMFADMAAAAENTGEKDPSMYSEGATKPAKKAEVPVNKEVKAQPKPEPKKEVKQEEPVRKPQPKPVSIPRDGVSVDSVGKILEMNDLLNKYVDSEQKFISMYFQAKAGDKADVIYKALTASPRDLEALQVIANAKTKSAADRAFYLMELSNQSVEDVYLQMTLLTEELTGGGEVTDVNKLKVCRKLESVIAGITDEMFKYINKLQEFSSKALN